MDFPNTPEARKALADLERYRRNKTLVPAEELAGKYKKPFEALKAELQTEVNALLRKALFEGMKFASDGKAVDFAKRMRDALTEHGYQQTARKAVFEEYDLRKAWALAAEENRKIREAGLYEEYVRGYDCLFVTEEAGGRRLARVYNDLTETFWDKASGKWVRDEDTRKRPHFITSLPKKGERRE